jgi:hypothetical protein
VLGAALLGGALALIALFAALQGGQRPKQD